MAASCADGSDDDLLQRFIVTGYVVLPPNPSVPASAHADIASSVLACGFQASGRRTPYGLAMLDGDAAGNNLLHAAPALRGEPCLASPALHSALRVLLGRGYRLHPHCRAHLRERGAKSTMWHVDAYKGTSWSSGRQHEPHWLMIMYYPQATSLSMGPTELLPGSQYYRGDSDREHYSRGHIPDFSEQMAAWATVPHALTCAAGTIVVMHYDLWHRALESHSTQPRLMLKLIACRTEPPPAPSGPLPPWPPLSSTGVLDFLFPTAAADEALLVGDGILLGTSQAAGAETSGSVEGDPNLDGILLGTSEAAGAETSGSVEGDPNLEGRVSVEGEADATATGVDSAVVAPATGADSAVVVQAVGAGAKGSSTKGNKGAAAGVPLPAEVATALAVLLIASDCV
jgi:hypothetical protein